MLTLRKFLIRLRSEYDSDPKRLFTYAILAVLLTALFSTLVDLFLPFGGISNIFRSLLLVPTSISIFVLSYSVSLSFHFKQMNNDPGWKPYRSRFSPMWRRRISIVVVAILLVMAQGVSRNAGYTLASSLLGAILISLLAFIRTSKEESAREELDIPDSRDVVYDAQKRKFERERARKKAAKKQNRGDFIAGKKKGAKDAKR